MPPVQLRAPAKLNLYLRIVGRRPDGYHELETVFERIDLADELTFEPWPDSTVTLTTDHPTLSVGPDNLILKAAKLLQQTAGVSTGAAIRLTKRIPVAGGLGGGSSDAATTLLGLNDLWGLSWSRARLKPLAAQLGSDVPFFLEEAAVAVGRGRGERCEPLRGVPTLWHVLVALPTALSTKDIFDDWDCAQAGAALTVPEGSLKILAHALSNGSLSELAQGLVNDLTPVAIRRCPLIATILSRLHEAGCPVVLMSGSGPTVFGLCRDESHARTIADSLRAKGSPTWTIHVVRTERCGGE
ncbi:MAG: 4-(cytidine 5'-diphospho)-2-C-methyl-D-erythritol kinase [Candidatus Omnitrophica bacterium]|nr:4-(cytidine 5'-diphospho)-2-C-methyl-D-erythritol kinase [Candidatus Omnitrophota bacterium]